VGPRTGLDRAVGKIQWERLKEISYKKTGRLVSTVFNDAVSVTEVCTLFECLYAKVVCSILAVTLCFTNISILRTSWMKIIVFV
jgi:hypothetical protein